MIISLSGSIGSGKNTAAEYIATKYTGTRLAFADSVKDAIAPIFGWDRTLLDGITDESRTWRETIDPWWATRLNIPQLTPRWVLQQYGTEVMRDHFHPEIWIASLERKLETLDGLVIIADARFSNELDMITRLNGTTIKVVQPANTSVAVHQSETQWLDFDFDYVITNNASKDALYWKLDYVMTQLEYS